jgi:Holliday junction resolvase
MLHRLKSSESGFRESLENACDDLGMARAQVISPVCLAYALLRSGAQPEVVSRVLSWRDFEGLVGALLRAAGFEVRENLVLTKPRAQVDVVGYGISMVLSIDCKHYRREQGPSKLVKFARDQLRRSSLLRVKSKDPRPIASVILTMSEPEGKFVEGVAVVPIRTFRSFLTTIDSNLDLLELR